MNLIDLFEQLVSIDSPSGEEKKVAEFIKVKLEEVGCDVEFDSYGNIFAKRKGIGEPFLFSCHMDTVEPGRNIKPIVNQEKGIIHASGDTILGGDPKAGIAALIFALFNTKDVEKRRKVEIVISREEEIGMVGIKHFDFTKLQSKVGLVLDGEGYPGNISISAPGYYQINAEIIGRGSHAGVAPEKGISAIKIGSEIISQLTLGRIDEESSVNIGTIKGGTARNAVPEKIYIEGEIRSRNDQQLEKLKSDINKTFYNVIKKYPDAKLNLGFYKEFEGFSISKNNKALVMIIDCMKDLCIASRLEDSGGGSDANIINAAGIEVVDIGVGTYELHSTREFVKIEEMKLVSKLCEYIISNTQ